MGCGDSKVILFEGTPDEEVLHYAHSIILAARSGESGKGPFKRVEHALNRILEAVKNDEAKISPKAADKLSEAVEALRMEHNKIFIKKLNDINVVRIQCCQKVSFEEGVGAESAEDVPQEKVPNNYPKLDWIPRVVAIEETDVNILGSSIELGLCGASAQALGFCVEAWILDNSPIKKGDSNPSIKLLDCPSGEGRVEGATPKFFIDKAGRVVLDFHKAAFNSGKNIIIEGQWNHVAYVYGRGNVKLYVNGRLSQMKNATIKFPEGHAALSICTGGTGFVTELRVWNGERTDEQITANMTKSISPTKAKDFPSLRLSWLPLSKEGFNFSPGSLLFDTWIRKPIGSRNSYPVIGDSRWVCALPPPLMPKDINFQLNHADEANEVWEHQQLTAVASQNFIRYQPTPSVVEEKALQIVNLLMQKGGPWVPRIVSLPPGTTASIGTTVELGLTGPVGFTVECWVRLRGAIDPTVENYILGIGYAEKAGENEGFTMSLRGGRPRCGFTAHEIESEAGIARLRWTHLCCVYDGKSMVKLYANGNLMAHGDCEPLKGNCSLTIGTNRNKDPLVGDMCEFRLWNRALSTEEINEMMKVSIPPLGGKAFPNLRLVWCPLRNGGPCSREFWCRRQTVFQSLVKATDVKPIEKPFPSLLWDVANGRDVGNLRDHAVLLTSRSRNMQIPVFIPPVHELPPAWSRSAASIVDEWTDCLDRAFVPRWYVPPLLDSEHVDESLSSFPSSAAEAAVRGGPWMPRVMRPVIGTNYSTLFGLTQEAGLLGVGTGGREYTLELWMRPRYVRERTNKKDPIQFEDLLGHEDAKSNEATGFFGTGKPFALRIGLANGRPFISLVGPISSLRQKDNKECVITKDKLPHNVWVHVAYVIQGDGKMMIFVNGEEAARAERIGPLQAKGDTNVHLFGYEERKWQTEICEMRIWGCARKQKDVEESMTKSYAPQPTGHPQVKGLRFSWFPCNSMRAILWDHKYITFRGSFSREEDVQFPHWTRRPEFLPPLIRKQVKSVPCCYVLDDIGDSYERNHAPGIVPPVLRDEWGEIDYDKHDTLFVPLKKKPEDGGGFSNMMPTDEREEIDVGWVDANDGTFTQRNERVIDDGGWHLGWGDVKEEIVEEVDLEHQESFSSAEASVDRAGGSCSHMETKDAYNESQHQSYHDGTSQHPEGEYDSQYQQVDPNAQPEGGEYYDQSYSYENQADQQQYDNQVDQQQQEDCQAQTEQEHQGSADMTAADSDNQLPEENTVEEHKTEE